MTFRIKGGQQAAHDFCKHTKVFTLAESLGGVESLCEHHISVQIHRVLNTTAHADKVIKDSGGLALFLGDTSDGMGGGMLSFRIKGGQQAAHDFCKHTKVFTLADLAQTLNTSQTLGEGEYLSVLAEIVSSLLSTLNTEVPSSMTHAGIPKEQREAAGVFDDLVRMSCGIETLGEGEYLSVLAEIVSSLLSTLNTEAEHTTTHADAQLPY
jgi:cystathionine beta-lyase/cystathionine gamma-synthase